MYHGRHSFINMAAYYRSLEAHYSANDGARRARVVHLPSPSPVVRRAASSSSSSSVASASSFPSASESVSGEGSDSFDSDSVDAGGAVAGALPFVASSPINRLIEADPLSLPPSYVSSGEPRYQWEKEERRQEEQQHRAPLIERRPIIPLLRLSARAAAPFMQPALTAASLSASSSSSSSSPFKLMAARSTMVSVADRASLHSASLAGSGRRPLALTSPHRYLFTIPESSPPSLAPHSSPSSSPLQSSASITSNFGAQLHGNCSSDARRSLWTTAYASCKTRWRSTTTAATAAASFPFSMSHLLLRSPAPSTAASMSTSLVVPAHSSSPSSAVAAASAALTTTLVWTDFLSDPTNIFALLLFALLFSSLNSSPRSPQLLSSPSSLANDTRPIAASTLLSLTLGS